MTRSISIRVDGNSKIGLGHIVRCTALAHILKQDFEVAFFCRNIPEAIAHEILKCGFNLTILDDEDTFLRYVNNNILSMIIISLSNFE